MAEPTENTHVNQNQAPNAQNTLPESSARDLTLSPAVPSVTAVTPQASPAPNAAPTPDMLHLFGMFTQFLASQAPHLLSPQPQTHSPATPPAVPVNLQTTPKSTPNPPMENAHSVQQIEERGAGSQAERNPDRIRAPGGVQNLEEEVERRNPGRHRVEEVADSHPGRNEPPRAVKRLDWEEQERSQRVRRPQGQKGEGSASKGKEPMENTGANGTIL